MQFYYPTDPNCWISQGYKPDHRAYDFAVMTGTDIYAVADGTVTLIKELKNSYGKYLIIDHADGYQSLYAHLSEFCVEVGETVLGGSVVAYSGNTGNSTGPHLHLEIKHNGSNIDYLYLLDPSLVPAKDLIIPDFNFSLPIFNVSVDNLRIRDDHSTNSRILGFLYSTDNVPVMEIFYDGDDIWARCGYRQWFAIRYSGLVFGKFYETS
jgi:murein DD-endopeptidase MepM/ murein hydrolase activator NlpD